MLTNSNFIKTTLGILLLLLVNTEVKSQGNAHLRETGVAMGLSGGMSSKQGPIGTLSVGALLPSQYLISANMLVLSEIKNPDIPTIFEARVGRFINTFEVYGGAGYHMAGSDSKIAANPNSGIKPALGVIKHFEGSPWIVGAGMSGSIFSLQIGLFGIR